MAMYGKSKKMNNLKMVIEAAKKKAKGTKGNKKKKNSPKNMGKMYE